MYEAVFKVLYETISKVLYEAVSKVLYEAVSKVLYEAVSKVPTKLSPKSSTKLSPKSSTKLSPKSSTKLSPKSSTQSVIRRGQRIRRNLPSRSRQLIPAYRELRSSRLLRWRKRTVTAEVLDLTHDTPSGAKRRKGSFEMPE